MASLHIHQAVDPALLLERAADGFLDPPRATAADPFPSPRYLLALRQGGLRDDLMDMAATRGCSGWFDPPLCIFHELPDWLGRTDRRALGDFERLALVSTLLRRHASRIFGRVYDAGEYVEAVDRWFGELIAEGTTAAEYDAALARCTARDDFERLRDDELAACYREYLEALAAEERRDGRDTILDCARAVRERPDDVASLMGGRREIRIVGLQDLRGGWRHLLSALSASPALERVSLYSSHPLDLDDIPHERVVLPEPPSIAAQLFRPEMVPAGDACSSRELSPHPVMLSAPDVERETEEIASRVRALIDGGVAPHRIAIVARKARPHVDLAIGALARFGIPATARRRTAYEEIPSVRAVLTMFAAAAEGWTRHALVEVAEHPYIGCDLDARVLDAIGYRRAVRGLDAWMAALAELAQEADAEDARTARGETRDLARRSGSPPPAAIARCREGFERFAAEARSLDAARPLSAWLTWIEDFIARDPWGIATRVAAVPVGRFDIVRLDLAGWEGLRAVIAEWKAALNRWPAADAPVTTPGFEHVLRAMLRADVALWTDTRRGVRVLEALAAQYRAFDHVFIVGMESGAFPSRAPRSPIIDDREREMLAAAGLPIERRALWDLRERELFRSLVAGARASLTLSWARLDAEGREVIPSALLEELADVVSPVRDSINTSRVLTPRLPLHREPEAVAHAERVARIERARAAGDSGEHGGYITDPELLAWIAGQYGDDHVWSPTQLEDWAKCPWAWFSRRLLRLENPGDPGDDLDPALRGAILHSALRRFYDGCVRRAGGAPIALGDDDATWAHEELAAALDFVLEEEAAARSWLGHPVLRDARRGELRRLLAEYLEFEIAENAKFSNNRTNRAKSIRTGVVRHEVPFRDVVLQRAGVTVRCRGSIDRVEHVLDDRIGSGAYIAAIDYKSSKGSTPGGGDKRAWDDGVVLQLPLYAHALRALHPEAEVTRIEYRALGQCTCVHSVDLHRVDPKTGGVSAREEESAKVERALDRVVEVVEGIRAGEFPAQPAPSCGCPPWCHGWDICRVPGGPRSARR